MTDRKRSILIAEDDDNDFWFFEKVLSKEAKGVSLVRTPNGLEAVRYLSGEGRYADRQTYPVPQLVILDLRMPIKDGFTVLEWFQQNPQLGWLPKIVFSSSEAAGDMERALRLGANSYLVKPRQFERYTTLVHLIIEYWLEWNQNPINGHNRITTSLPSQVRESERP